MRRESGTTLGTRGVLVFPVGEILFGAPVEEVAGLIEADRVAPLPRRENGLSGVLAFRGSMVPVVDLCEWLGVPGPAPGPTGEAVRYGMVLSRGVERFALLLPSIPRLVPGRELKESDESIADGELGALIGSVYMAGSDRIHCLRCWGIFEAVMPPVTVGAADPGPGAHDDR